MLHSRPIHSRIVPLVLSATLGGTLGLGPRLALADATGESAVKRGHALKVAAPSAVEGAAPTAAPSAIPAAATTPMAPASIPAPDATLSERLRQNWKWLALGGGVLVVSAVVVGVAIGISSAENTYPSGSLGTLDRR